MLTSTTIIVVVALVVLIYYHFKSRYGRRLAVAAAAQAPQRSIRHRFIFIEVPRDSIAATATQALDPAVLREIPLVVFSGKDRDPISCAVCIGEIAEGEVARILPKCGHGFHADCIDMWFQSHATCPLCRAAVEAVQGLVFATETKMAMERGYLETEEPDLELGVTAAPAAVRS